jgi:hypothetical protein
LLKRSAISLGSLLQFGVDIGGDISDQNVRHAYIMQSCSAMSILLIYGLSAYHHLENGRGSPTGVALDVVRAGNHASSRPEPSGVAAEREWIPRKPSDLTPAPIG